MKRRAFLLAQVMVLGAIALALAFAAFSRTANQLHLVRKALDAEQDGLMLDALEGLSAGAPGAEPGALSAKGWDVLSVTKSADGWTLRAGAAGRAEITRALAASK